MHVEKHQLLDYLSSRGSKLACCYCNNQEWHMLIQKVENIKNQLMMPFSLFNRDSGESSCAPLDVIVMVCTNCGHTRMHSKGKIVSDLARSATGHGTGD